MNIKEIASAIGMSRNSVAKYLDVLTATGQLDVRQIGNAKLYYLSHRVPVKDLLQITHEMIVMLDGYMRIVQASDSFIAFIGCSREQVQGSRLSRLLSRSSRKKRRPSCRPFSMADRPGQRRYGS